MYASFFAVFGLETGPVVLDSQDWLLTPYSLNGRCYCSALMVEPSNLINTK